VRSLFDPGAGRLRAIFDKAGAARQAEPVRLVLRGVATPGTVRAGSARG